MLALTLLLAAPWAANAQFCTPSPSSKDANGITNVSYGEGTETVNSAITWSSAPYYQDNRSTIGAIPAGNTCEVSITFATSYSYGYIIWVDYNNDSTFSGTEVVAVGEAPSTNPVTITAEFDIPATQDTGTYMMRICAADSYFDSYTGSIAAAATADPCASYTWGVALDYTLRVTEASSCLRVQSISASDILDDGMTINWVDTLNSTTYTLSYWPSNAGVGDTVEISSLNGFSYTVTSLDANTLYYFSIVPDCSDGSVAARTGSFRTDCANGSCNMVVNGTDSYGDGWNNNALNFYQGGALISTVTIASGDSITEQILVCKGDSVVITFTSGSWASEMGGAILDGGGNTIFTIENMGNYADGITLATVANACPDCLAPRDLADSIADNGEVVLSWTGSASTYMVYCGDSLYDGSVSDTFFTFIGLSASSMYQLGVASICDNGDTSSIAHLTVVTPCGDITALPWAEGFELGNGYAAPTCWTVLRSTSNYNGNYPYIYEYSHHSGQKSLYFSTTYYDDTNLVVSSRFTVNPGNMHITFWLYPSMYYGSVFEAGLMSDTTDMSTFVSLFSINNGSPNYVSYSWSQFEFFTDESGFEDGDSAYLAFRMVGPASTGYGDYAYLDEITATAIPNCRMPLSGSGVIDSVNHESAYFAWDGTSESGYVLKLVHYTYDTAGTLTGTVENHIYCDSSYISVNNLESNTTYYAYVATICDNNGTIDTTDYLDLGNFQTQLRCYPVYRASLSVLTTTAAVINWNYRSNMGIAGSGAILTLTDLSDSTVSPTTQTVLGDNTVSYTGLTTGHNYSVTLNSLCGAEDTADSQTIFFTPHTPECAQIGNGTDETYSTPFYGYYNYSYSQTIYSDTLLAGIDTLTGISYNAYFYYNDYIGVNNYEADIYIGYVDTSVLTYNNGQYWFSNSNIAVDSTMTKVATGSRMSVTGNNWFYLPFDTPFNVAPHDDGKLLIVTVVGHTLSLENTYNYWIGTYDYNYDYTTYNTYTKTRYYYGNDIINPATTSSYYGYYVPNIRFFGNCGGNCMAPSANITDVSSNSVSLAWLPNGSETSWRVEYKLSTDTTWTLAATVTNSSYTVNGLAANTEYDVRVGAVCTDTVTYATLSFSTLCATVTIPYTHTFTDADPCWSTDITYYSTDGANVYSSRHLISPELPTPVSDLMVIITDRCYSTSASNQGYIVAVCDAAGQNMTVIDTVYATEGTAFGTHTVYLNNYTGNYNHIYITNITNGDIFVQSITFDLAPHCMPATNLTVDSVNLNSIAFSWTSDASSFQVNYRAEGDTGAWSTVTVNTTHVVISGLTPSTTYNVEVRPVCGDGTLSTPLSDAIGTICLTYNTPYNQTSFYSIPTCWSTYNTGHPTTTWAQSVNDGYGYIYSYASGSATASNDWLMSPEIIIPTTAAADSIMLVYQIAGQTSASSTGSTASYMVLASTNGGNTSSDYTDTLLTETVTSTNFAYRHISLSQYAGDTIRIAFRSTCAGYGMVGMYDFGMRSVLFPLYHIQGAGTVYVGDTNTYIGVHIEGDSATDNYTWTSTKVAAGQAVMSGSTSNTMEIIYATPGYDTITLITSNTYGNDTSRAIVHIIDIAPVTSYPYTTGFESGNTDNDSWITKNGSNAWYIGDATNNGGSQALYISQDNGATNTYNVNTTSISYAYRALQISDTGEYTFQFDWIANGESNYDYIRAFLVPDDYMSVTANIYPDGSTSAYSFTTASVNGWINLGEKLNQVSTWNTQYDTVNITATGRYFLVFMWGNDYSAGTNPPAAIDNIIVNNGSAFVTCAAPVVSGIDRDETALTVNFSSDADSVELIIVQGQMFNENAASVIATGNNYTFTGLNHSSVYTIGLRSICSTDDLSDWTIVADSTLTVNCGVPTGLTVESTGYTSVTLSWTAAGEEHAWEVMAYNTLDTVLATSSTTSATVSGLMASTQYNAKVRALCGQNADVEGDWSEPIQFATDVCAPVTGVTVNNITGNTADVSWTAPEGATTFRVAYGLLDFSQSDEIGIYTTTESQYHLTDLDASTQYTVRVANLCTESLASQYTSYDFTTGAQGIATIDTEGNISIYPNPASAMVTISVSEQMAYATVTIVDLNGRTVYSNSINQAITLDVSTLAKGAYFVRITGEQATAVHKLIVK